MSNLASQNDDPISAKEYFYVGLVLVVALCVVFFRDIYNGANFYVLYFSDAIPFYLFYPSEHFTSRQIADGYFPLWDHLRGLGEPNIVPLGVTMFNPLRLIPFLFKGDFGLSLFVLARLWLCGMSMYYAGRRFNLGIAGAMVSAISYMFGGFFMEFISFQDINAYVFTPMALGLWKKWTRRQTVLTYFIMAYVVNIVGSAGHPEAIFNFGALNVFFAIMMCFSPELADQSKKKIITLWLITLTAGFTFRFFEWLIFTEFWVNGWQYHQADFGLMAHNVKMLPSLIHPFFNLGTLTLKNNEIFSRVIPWPPSHIGFITLTLAITALFRARRIPFEALIAALVFFVAVGMIFGVPVFSELARLPILNASHNHRYLQPLAAFGASVLAGAGLKIILDDPKGRTAMLAVYTALVLTLYSIISGAWDANITPIAEYKRFFPAIAACVFLFALFSAGIFLLIARKKISARAAPIAVILLLFMDLAVSSHFVGTPGVQRKTAPKTILSDSPENWKGTGRIYGTQRDILHPNLAELFDLADLRDQSPIMPKRYARLLIKINGLKDDKDILKNFMTSGYFLSFNLREIDPAWLDLLGVDRVLSAVPPTAVSLWQDVAKKWSGYQPTGGAVAVLNVKENNATYPALVFKTPGAIKSDVAIPPRAKSLSLTFLGKKLCQSLTVGKDGVFKTLFARCFKDGEILSNEAEIDIKEFAGQTVEMTLTSVPVKEGARIYTAWLDGFINDDKADPTLELIRHSDFRVYKNNDALPIAFAISGEPPEEPPTDAGAFKNRVRTGVVKNIINDAQKVSMEVAPEEGDWLMTSRVYFPGWRAFVTDKYGATQDRKIVPRMEAFSCLLLSPDDRKATFIYHPPTFRFLIWFAIVNHLFFAVMICAAAARRISSSKLDGR